VLLAACPEIQGSRALVAVNVVGALVVKADGILAFSLHAAPGFVVLYFAIAAVAARRRRRRPAVRARGLPAIVES
jgi:hypothetical protein